MALVLDQIRGHEKIRRALFAAIQKDKLSSALLFLGPEAVGKKLLALSVAQHLLCESDTPPCGSCGSCLRVFKRQHEGLLIIESEESQLKLDDIQPIFDFVRLKLISRARIIVINDTHKLNIQAANRLLKTLEEPPPHTYFILITSQESALPTTIRSRCQLVRFGPLSIPDLRLMMDAPGWAYNASQGRMDLLTKLTKESGEERKFAFDLFKGYLLDPRSYVFPQLSEFAKDKEKSLEIVAFFEQFLRDLWMDSSERLVHRDLEIEYQKLKQHLNSQKIDRLWTHLENLKRNIEMNADRTLNFENLWFQIQEGH